MFRNSCKKGVYMQTATQYVRKPEVITARQMDFTGLIRKADWEVSFNEGDWLVWEGSQDQKPQVLSNEVFTSRYQVATSSKQCTGGIAYTSSPVIVSSYFWGY